MPLCRSGLAQPWSRRHRSSGTACAHVPRAAGAPCSSLGPEPCCELSSVRRGGARVSDAPGEQLNCCNPQCHNRKRDGIVFQPHKHDALQSANRGDDGHSCICGQNNSLRLSIPYRWRRCIEARGRHIGRGVLLLAAGGACCAGGVLRQAAEGEERIR